MTLLEKANQALAAMTIADHLTAAREAHASYRRIANSPGRREPKRASIRATLTQARDARQAAHDADPTHADAAWSEDSSQHDALMAFYQQQIGEGQ